MPSQPLDIKIVVFDLDGTLVLQRSSWSHIHGKLGIDNGAVVEAYLRGEFDDMEFMRRDIARWRAKLAHMHIRDITHLLSDISPLKGGHEAIKCIKSRGMKAGILSAGIDILACRISDDLGMDFCYSNGLEIDESGHLTGEGVLGVPILGKGEIIEQIARENGCLPENIAAVGDSIVDIHMFKKAGLAIAFCPMTEEVAKSAHCVINKPDLMLVCKALGI